MLNLVRKTQTKSLTWSASKTVSQDIDAAGALTAINLRVAITPSATMASAHATLGLQRVIDSITIKGSGGVNYLSMGSEQIGRMLHLLARYDGLLRGPGSQQLADAIEVIFPIHFGSRPVDQYGRRNPFDLSAFIPAFEDSQLTLEWKTTANTVMDATVTLSSAIMYLEIFEVLGTAAEIKAEMQRQAVRQAMIPVSSYVFNAHTANKSNLSDEHNVPAGNLLRRIVLLVQDDTGTRPELADDEVTRLGLHLASNNQWLVDTDFVTLNYAQGTIATLPEADVGVTQGQAQVMPGFAVLDLRQHANPDYGLDLRKYGVGDVKLGLTIENYASGDDSAIWYDQVTPFAF